MMKIDAERVMREILDFIQKKVSQEGKEGVALGLSGGIDSAVLAALAARAVSPSKVFALHLFDFDSEIKFRIYAATLSKKLGIHLEIKDISPVDQPKNPHWVRLMRAIRCAPILNQVMVYLSHFLCDAFYHESPFELILRAGGP
jgi:NAD+ synthase